MNLSLLKYKYREYKKNMHYFKNQLYTIGMEKILKVLYNIYYIIYINNNFINNY